ncbi:oxygen-insensitive NAD(P)H nitroreductase [Dictyobacter formicarum]|uniref:Oxygen-insensitive NAD(P)H-dependent nitroreductase NfsB n=1 Tax=Dictyobacter formicarum TaxID=2778368 RepID=A0ABQ3VPR5_9CHLR|nr:oxygen-insensitive NAD(P)H nitroreductase [Dictyobacter formicarum]GHO87593.1 oxygen-insensitive NAD(P)H-dependent nitroreductase NfsB [Dictyobacter formicarum]
MNLTKITQTGHMTKAFDPDRRIPQETIDTLLEFLRFSPSSVNVQPWHFFVASTQEGKERIAKEMRPEQAVNAVKVENASHVIVFCTRMSLPTGYMDIMLDKEERDGWFKSASAKKHWGDSASDWVSLHEYDYKDLQHWMEKQTYMALGMLLIAAAEFGIDVSPLEGFDPRRLDAELGLREKGFTSSVLLPLGYRDFEKDHAVHTPKSRLSKEELFTFI